MSPAQLLSHFDRISEAPDASPRLRRFILDLAVRGKLVEQDPRDEPAPELLKRIQEEKEQLILKGEYRRQKPLPDAHAEDALFKCPGSWRWTPLGTVTSITQGFAFPSERFSSNKEDGPPLIKIGDIGLNNPTVFVRGEYESAYLVHDGDLLLGLSGSIKCATWEGPPALLNQRIARIAPVPNGLNPKWLLFCVKKCIEIWISETSKLTVQNVKAHQLYEAIIPVPPLGEQQRIVAKVGELMALCDRLETAQAERERRRHRLATASLQRLNNGADPDAFRDHARFYFNHLPRLTTKLKHIHQLRQTILNLAVRGKLAPQDPNDEPAAELVRRIGAVKDRLGQKGKKHTSETLLEISEGAMPFRVPKSWHWVRFGDLVIDADAGWSPKSEGFPRSSDNWGVLKVSAVSWGKFLPGENKQLLPGVIPPKSAQVRSGDFLISRANTRELVAKCVVVWDAPRNLILSDKIVRLHIHAECDKQFLCIVNNHARHARSYYAEEASGTSLSMQNVSRAVIYGLLIPLPPAKEQHRIVAKVDQLMTLCDKLEAQLTTTQANSRRLLQSVLHQILVPAV